MMVKFASMKNMKNKMQIKHIKTVVPLRYPHFFNQTSHVKDLKILNRSQAVVFRLALGTPLFLFPKSISKYILYHIYIIFIYHIYISYLYIIFIYHIYISYPIFIVRNHQHLSTFIKAQPTSANKRHEIQQKPGNNWRFPKMGGTMGYHPFWGSPISDIGPRSKAFKKNTS